MHRRRQWVNMKPVLFVFQNCCTIPYNFSVSENRPAQQYVGRVQATDRDQGENARIIYHIIGQLHNTNKC